MGWLDDLLAALGEDQAAVVGVSLGGWIALQYAIARPERVSKLALLCPGGVTAPRTSWMLRLIALSLLGEWGAEAIKRAMFRDVPVSAEVEAFMELVQAHYRPRIEAPPVFTDQELEKVRMPTLLVAGEKDVAYNSAKTAARLGKLLPHFQAVLLPEAGHVLLDTPVQVMPFLESVYRPKAAPTDRGIRTRHTCGTRGNVGQGCPTYVGALPATLPLDTTVRSSTSLSDSRSLFTRRGKRYSDQTDVDR